MNFISWRPPDTGRTAMRPELNATPVASETAGENIYLFRGREMKRSHVKSQSWVSSKEYLTQDSWSCQLISTEPGSHCGAWANPPEHDIHLSAVRLWATWCAVTIIGPSLETIRSADGVRRQQQQGKARIRARRLCTTGPSGNVHGLFRSRDAWIQSSTNRAEAPVWSIHYKCHVEETSDPCSDTYGG